jgi:outer membrane receptor protein involved in Fe transport
MKSSLFKLLASASALVVAQAAAAQTAPANDSAPASTPQTTADPQADAAVQPEAETAAQDIIVTGSRTTTNANSPTPMVALPAEQFLKLTPGSITEAASLLPALQGSQNLSSRPGGGQRNGAGAYFNLRNMGNLRTLVLVDSMRLIPTINQNEADTDASIVPQMLIKRLDVVTGGVSAVYGSDAVSGVVNFITDRDFNGVKFQASKSISTYGDDPISDFGVAAGTRFAGGRGHIEFSYQYRQDAGLIDRRSTLDRDFFAANTGNAGTGTAANPYFNVPDARLSNTTFGGLIISSSVAADTTTLRNLQFGSTGQLSPFVHGLVPVAGGTFAPFGTAGITAATANLESGGDGGYFASSAIKSSLKFHQAFGRVDYDLTDNLHFFAELGYSRVLTATQFRSPTFTAGAGSLRFSYSNPYLLLTQDPYRALFLANPTRTLNINEILLNAPRATQLTEAYIGFAGLEGKLGSKFTWNIGGGYQQSTILARDLLNIDRGKLAAALDAVDVGFVTTGTRNGVIACRAAVTYAGHAANPNYAGCVPLNVFGGIDAASPAAKTYLYDATFNRNRSRMETLSGSITGSPFDTWAGPVKVALSGEYRRLRWNADSNTDPAQFADCTGISFNCTQGTTLRWFNNTMAPVAQVEQKVTEGAFEATVPLLKNVPFFKSLELTGAARYTDYSTSGHVTTWKLGADWKISSDLRLRATRSRDIRAPNLFELFTSTQINTGITAADPLTGATFGPFANTQTGNRNLRPETANTLTVGAVLTPSFIPGLSLSVDYYRIQVKDVIFLLQGFSAQVLQTCKATQGASPACVLVSRPSWTDTNAATNPITATTSTYLNIAKQDTWGIDTELNYNTRLFGNAFNFRVLAAYQPSLVYDQGPAGVLSVAGAYNAGSNRLSAAPKWRVTGVVSYDITQDISVTVLERWRSGLNAIYDPTLVVVNPKMPGIAYTNLNLSYKVNDTKLGSFEMFATVANLFNKFPTVYYTNQVTQPSTQPFTPEGDDTIGRVFTAGVKVKF